MFCAKATARWYEQAVRANTLTQSYFLIFYVLKPHSVTYNTTSVNRQKKTHSLCTVAFVANVSKLRISLHYNVLKWKSIVTYHLLKLVWNVHSYRIVRSLSVYNRRLVHSMAWMKICDLLSTLQLSIWYQRRWRRKTISSDQCHFI